MCDRTALRRDDTDAREGCLAKQKRKVHELFPVPGDIDLV